MERWSLHSWTPASFNWKSLYFNVFLELNLNESTFWLSYTSIYWYEWHFIRAIDRVFKVVFAFSSRSHRSKRTHLINLNMQIILQTPLNHQTGSSIKWRCIKLCVFREEFSQVASIVVPSTKPATVVIWQRANRSCALNGVCKSMSLQRKIDYLRVRPGGKKRCPTCETSPQATRGSSYSIRLRGKGWFVFFAKSITTISNATTASRDRR